MTDNNKILAEENAGEINELQFDKARVAKYPNAGFIYGDKVEPVWWHELQGEERITPDGKIKDGYKFDFVDGSEITLTHLQLFSILNDRNLHNINHNQWTLLSLDKNTWQGTFAEKPVWRKF